MSVGSAGMSKSSAHFGHATFWPLRVCETISFASQEGHLIMKESSIVRLAFAARNKRPSERRALDLCRSNGRIHKVPGIMHLQDRASNDPQTKA